MKYSNIIWDFDGTLFDTYPSMASSMKNVLSELGIDAPIQDVVAFLKVSMGTVISHYTGKYNKQDLLDQYGAIHEKVDISTVRPFEYVEDILYRVSKLGGNNFIFTHRGKSAYKYLEHYGMLPYFREVVSSSGVFARKPSPEGNLYIINKYQLDQGSTLAIGDREIDIIAARNAKIASCLFSESGTVNGSMADYQIRTFYELYDILKFS